MWRIKEEPHLWRRYGHDGILLLRLLLTRVLPLAVANRCDQLRAERQPRELAIKIENHHNSVMIRLGGDATEPHVAKAIACFRETLTCGSKDIVVDLSGVRVIDGRFFGLLLMFRKQLKGQGAKLTFVGASPTTKRRFRLNELGFLLSSE